MVELAVEALATAAAGSEEGVEVEAQVAEVTAVAEALMEAV